MRRSAIVVAALSAFLCTSTSAALVTRSVSGPNAAAIVGARDSFRTDLGGGTVAGANGLFSDGTGARREINWDGVPQAQAAPNNLLANFFNSNSPRGAVFSTAGTGFQVSGATTDAGGGQPAPEDFGNIDPTYNTAFDDFSPQRLFTALGSNVLDVNFFVPGTTVPALTRGFGAIFSDVDLPNTTSIELFDLLGASLGKFAVPAAGAGNATFSFLGISFTDPVISRVRITNGNAALGAGVLDQNGSANDLVVMDDFLYAEPRAAVPLPATLWLVVLALPLLAGRRRD